MSLVVYKSSAGSGKTHTLVLEYLKITLQNPDKYRRVLAITFTNKAAGEMKERIISTLQSLSDEDTDTIMAQSLIERLKFTPELLTERAKKLLANIVHHYEDFGISTIDSFVHRIIRTFANDVKLPYGFEVVIENEDIIPDIIEDLYDKLGDDKMLTNIMIEFVLSLTDDEKSYNPDRMLVEFINKQTGEEGFEAIKKLEKISLERFLEIITLINKKLHNLKKEINAAASEAMSLIETNGIEISSFYQGKRGLPAWFKKNQNRISEKTLVPSSYARKTVVEDKWFSSNADSGDKATIESIKDDLVDRYQIIENKGKEYLYFKIVYDKLYAVALTRQIRMLFDDFIVRTGKVHISDFNKKISDSIAGQPAPFIFERLGNRYDHFLIDEFQDTSLLQWYNLLPLIENSLAFGNFNMLVGDAKQAIYRFRSGEVELFTSLPALYGKPDLPDKAQREKLLKETFEEKYLDTNYRSYKEIVDFNNHFFQVVAGEDDRELIKNIYSRHQQKVSENKKQGGYVSIELIEFEDTDDYRTKRLDKIIQYINQLQANGFSYSDICILVRNGKDATEDASWLLANNIPVISSESLLLSGSPRVRAVVALVKSLLTPDNPAALAELLQNLVIIKNKQDEFEELSLRFCHDRVSSLKKLLQWASIDTPLDELKQKPVYELAESVFKHLDSSGKPDIRFQYFLDFILEKQTVFENRHDQFLELWEQKKEKLFITMPEGEEAVQLMTIHKAKGLKFQVVIVDFQERKSQKTKEELWTEINLPGIPDLPVTLLPIQKEKLTAIGREDIYEHEMDKSHLDFLNLIYVAFTRPVEALFILAEAPQKGTKEVFSKTIHGFLENAEESPGDRLRYKYGELVKLEMVPQRLPKSVQLSSWISNGGDFPVKVAPPDELYWQTKGEVSQRVKGNLIHEILSRIKTRKDVTKTLNLYLTKGIIDNKEQTELTTEINNIVNHPELKPFFNDSVTVKNETEIVLQNGSLIRPDRIVINDDTVTIIDYKTGEEEKEHFRQVGEYMQAFTGLGYQTVNGLLVYIKDEVKVVKVPGL